MKKVETPLDRMRAARTSGEAEYTAEMMTLDKLHVDVFETPQGKEWMARSEEILLRRVTAPDISDGALRGLEHTRNFLRTIKDRIERFHKHGGRAKE